ncbi:hypothetical protein DICVIV_06648 [Dictyocaulus viviparus]|uniref:Uncharacterized protein n=1 Tax=Dictyocaulus viviparus TaxID=29172 RepID=A0A0D8XTW1_DICVI|nr:hypothetical protein DICVIV_06648 [Dictyocaulus viviparus]
MSSWDLSSPDNSEFSLSPPSYSVQEDASSGDLRSRRRQKWPDRPEFGRYSLQYEYFDQKRFKTEREKRERKRNKFIDHQLYSNRAAAGVSSKSAMYSASDMILPFHSSTAPTAMSSDQLVQTSMLCSSTNDVDQTYSLRSSTTDDLLTLGGLLPTRSQSLVPSELLRSSFTDLHNDSMALPFSSIPIELEGEIVNGNSDQYRFIGNSTDQAAMSALKQYPFVVFTNRNKPEIKVGFLVEGKPQLFVVEILNTYEGGILWRITGTTFSIGFRSLEEMAQFYCRFPTTAV